MGDDVYLNSDVGYIPLVANPLTAINAHAHNKNHPSGFIKTKRVIDCLNQYPECNWKSFYPSRLHLDAAAAELGIPIGNTLSTELTDTLNEHINADWVKIWDYAHSQGFHRIYVELPDDVAWYPSAAFRILRKQLLNSSAYESENHAQDDFINVFFGEAKMAYGGSFTNDWDKREFLALNIRQRKESRILDFSTPHQLISAKSLWHDGEATLRKILGELNLPVVESRMDAWLPIYSKWQASQLKILKFVYDIDAIVDAVINNHDFDLSPYNLTLRQEAIIQHVLIYKHNLTIKNWELSKFPSNAQGLHLLLEDNFHPVEKLY